MKIFFSMGISGGGTCPPCPPLFSMPLLGRGSFREVAVMEYGLKRTSRVCRRLVADVTGEVGIVECGLQ